MKSLEKQGMTQQGIKALHFKQIYLHCLHSDGISRAQLRRSMGLSFPSVSALVDELIDREILEETGIVTGSSRGRPSTLLQVKADRFVIPVVQLDHDSYHCKVFDFAARELSNRFIPYGFEEHTVPIRNGRRCPSIEAMADPLTQYIMESKKKAEPLALIISTPGSVSASGAFSSSSIRIASPDGFLSYLESATGLDIFVGNTSDHYAYAEYHSSQIQEDFALLLIGHGVGASIVRHGRLFDAKPLRAGEIGHISIDYRGRPCLCGGCGCLERYVSADAFAEDAGMDYSELCECVLAGDEGAIAFIQQKADLLAVGISNMLTMQPVKQIVLGGQIRQLGEPFLTALQNSVKRIGFRKQMNDIALRYSAEMDDPEILGALWNYIENQMKMDSLLDTVI